MDTHVRSILTIFTAIAIALALAFAGDSEHLEAKKNKRKKVSAPTAAASAELDPLRILKRFQDAPAPRKYKAKKRAKGVPPPPSTDPIGPNVIFAVDTSVRMQFDEDGAYFDLGLWGRGPTAPPGKAVVCHIPPGTSQVIDQSEVPAHLGHGDTLGPCEGSTGEVADSLGVDPLATGYRRVYHNLIDDDGEDPGAPWNDRDMEADSISVVDDQDADYADFFDVTRLGIARDGLAQVVDENEAIVRFGLVRSRYGSGAAIPAVGNQQPVELETAPQNALDGDLGAGDWKITVAYTTSQNDDATASGTEVIVAADALASGDLVEAVLALEPDAGGLLPAGRSFDDSQDSPIGNLLQDTRAEVVRLMAADDQLYRECRNTAVVLVVGGNGGNIDPAVVAASFSAVTSGGVTRRVPIFVIALTPAPADVPTLRAIATSSGGKYFEATNGNDVALAANYAVAAAHARYEDYDLGVKSIFQTTSPIIGSVDLSNADDINGVPLINSVVTGPSGALITQKANVLLTAGFSLPTFEADLRAFRVYRPALDATKPLGYKFVQDGTALWTAHTPGATPRNIYTYVPGAGMIPFTNDAATAAALRSYLGVSTDLEAAELIAFVRAQPLGAIIDSTPAVMDPPSLSPAPDPDYATFATQRASRRSMVFYGGNDGMVHGLDTRLGVEVWSFIPFNLLPKLRTLLDGQPVDDFAYFVDSSPKVADVKAGGVWRTMMFIGEGPGGTFYQAFDVSDAGLGVAPDSDSETAVVTAFSNANQIPFMWSFPQYSSFDHTIVTEFTPWGDIAASASVVEKTVGRTWSDPAVGQIEDATGPYVMMTGSGFLATPVQDLPHRGGVRAGSTFYLIDVGSGAVHDSFDVGDAVGKTHLKNALHADPTATGPPDSRFVDQIYVGDTEGNLWRFGASVSGGAASLSSPVKTYDAGQEHPLYASLATVNLGGPIQYVFLATGIDILPTESKLVAFNLVGIKDDRSKDKKRKEAVQIHAGARETQKGRLESVQRRRTPDLGTGGGGRRGVLHHHDRVSVRPVSLSGKCALRADLRRQSSLQRR